MISAIRPYVRSGYQRWLRPRLPRIWQQRVKLLWAGWGYHPVLTIPTLGLSARVSLLFRLLRVDWHVPHAHWPGELARVIKAIGRRRAAPGEVVVEAGCWLGGSTAKLSVICHMLGYKLLVYDSFAGVEPQPGNSFSGRYAATLSTVRRNVSEYGEIRVCEFTPGWFADTLAKRPVRRPVAAAYLDCDLAKGTYEVLQGILPSFVQNGALCSQDYFIREVRALLDGQDVWCRLPRPKVTGRYRNLAMFTVTRSEVSSRQ